MSFIKRSDKFRIEPTAAQRPGFVQAAGARRWVWNWALERRIRYYATHKTTLSVTALCKELTALKRQPETAWLNDVDSQALQQAIRDLAAAFDQFFARRARFPKFKTRKRDRLRFRIPQRVKVERNRVYVPKIGWVKLRQSRPLQGRLTSATFSRDATGCWDVSFATELEVPDAPLPPVNPARTVGLDDGLQDFVVLSTGQTIPAPRFFRKGEASLRRAHRHLSRCQRGSTRRVKARLRLARLHRKIANRRRDFVHQTTSALVRAHDGVCLQDLSVQGLARTKLAKSVTDAALGELHRQLRYKTAWHHRHHAVVDHWFPSSKRCSVCGALHDGLRLSDRVWTCVCGAVHDRDLNAARNILAEGLRLLTTSPRDTRETENARRGAVSPPTGRQAPMTRESPGR